MKLTERMQRRLLLIGAGHAHVGVLKSFAMNPVPGVELVLVNPHTETLYSGMLPGFVAGLYKVEEIVLDAHALAAEAGALFVRDEAVRVDGDTVHFRKRPPLSFDLLSIDIGSTSKIRDPAFDLDAFIATRPFSRLKEKLRVWDSMWKAGNCGRKIAIVGGGAAGFEMAFAFKVRFPGAEISIYDKRRIYSGPEARALAKRKIRLVRERAELTVESGKIFVNGVHSDFVLSATGAEAHSLVRDSGLPHENGFLKVDASLSVPENRNIFGAGDCIKLPFPWVEKAGVFAVRETPYLVANLRAGLLGQPLKNYIPQKKYLKILNLCDGEAIAKRGSLAIGGKWAWKWKDSIDRAFMQKFQRDPAPSLEPDCGGCGSKVSADVLCASLPVQKKSASTLWGVNEKEDVALWKVDAQSMGFTIDQFRNFGVDPYLFGRIAAISAASDLYAKNIVPQAALMSLTMPKFSSRLAKDWLKQLFAGVNDLFGNESIELLGGQTNEGEEWNLGFTLWGKAGEKLWEKRSVQLDDALILTKPLGTGILLAAAMEGANLGEDLDTALASMAVSQYEAWKKIKNFSIHASTDVTGFSLLGHLSEMLEGRFGADLVLEQIPLLPGARKWHEKGFQSRMHALNAKSFPGVFSAEAAILYDPQTAGGLLLSVPESAVAGILQALPSSARIGTVTDKKIRVL